VRCSKLFHRRKQQQRRHWVDAGPRVLLFCSQRNALYKLLHDARLRLKRRLACEGLSPAEILIVFERT